MSPPWRQEFPVLMTNTPGPLLRFDYSTASLSRHLLHLTARMDRDLSPNKMDAFSYAEYPPAISAEQEEYLLATVKDWSIQHGLAVRPSAVFVSKDIDKSRVLATTAPVTLFPSPFPKECFEQGRLLQTTYNELYAAISNDEEWIEDIMTG